MGRLVEKFDREPAADPIIREGNRGEKSDKKRSRDVDGCVAVLRRFSDFISTCCPHFHSDSPPKRLPGTILKIANHRLEIFPER